MWSEIFQWVSCKRKQENKVVAGGLIWLAGHFFLGDGTCYSLLVTAENDPAERKTLMRQKKGGRIFRSKVLEKWRGNRIQCSSSGTDKS